MNIECLGTVGIVYTKKVPYWYKRGGYYVGDRWVKAKKIRKYKTVPIKEPYLSGDIQLRVNADCILGGVYVDENGKNYMCISKQTINGTSSFLRIVTMNLGKTFSVPKNITHIMTQISET